MKHSFKTRAKELQNANAAAKGHVIEYTNTRYSEGTAIAGSSTGSVKTALPLPPQPLLVKFPLPPPPLTLPLNSNPDVSITSGNSPKKKTQVSTRQIPVFDIQFTTH
jgi:hypothetical protein